MTDELFSDRQPKAFNQLLEQYVYSVAVNFIDQIDSDTQTRVIKLFFHVGKVPPVESLPVRLKEPLLSVINKRIAQKRTYRNERIVFIERLITFQQARIDSLSGCILKLDQLVERAQKSISDINRRTVLINHYQSIKNGYAAHLTKLQVSQQYEISKLA